MLRPALPAFRLARQPAVRANSARHFSAALRRQAESTFTHQRNIAGISPKTLTSYATVAGGFGAFAGLAALFFFAEIPRVRDDIMLQIPIVREWFKKEIAPEDNPF